VIPILHIPWDDGRLGPYLSANVAVNPNVNDDERLWLALCGIRGWPPGERQKWADQARAYAGTGTPGGAAVRARDEAATRAEAAAAAMRNLWQIRVPSEVVIAVAASSAAPTGVYKRPATGIGQVRGVAFAVWSLSRAYSDVAIRNVYLSTDPLQDRRERDLLVFGGPKNNQISADLLAALEADQPAQQRDSTFIWRRMVNKLWSADGAEEFCGEAEAENIVSDYGLIIRARNPFTTKDRTAVLLAGSHTHGTMAATKYFIENLLDERPSSARPDNLAVLVECRVRDGFPISMKITKEYSWPRS
jgi:hypothetical protein